MTISKTALLQNVLLGGLEAGEIERVNDDLFVRIKEIVITDEGVELVSVGGHKIPVANSVHSFSKVLAGGGVFIVPLHGTLLKASILQT
jgi:hypothetical protein